MSVKAKCLPNKGIDNIDALSFYIPLGLTSNFGLDLRENNILDL